MAASSPRAKRPSLFDRPPVRRIWRQCRTGRAPPDHARPQRRARRALLHAAGRSGGQYLEALCRRELPLLALRRVVPALEPPRRLPDRRARRSPRSSRPPTASATSPCRGPSTARSRPTCRAGCSRSGSAATSNMPIACRAPTGIDLGNPPVTPVGPACAICPRVDCPHRATAPAGRLLAVEENRKTISPYPFVRDRTRNACFSWICNWRNSTRGPMHCASKSQLEKEQRK